MKMEWIERYMLDAERLIVQGGDQLHAGMNILNGLLYDEPGYGNLHNHLGWAHLYYTLDLAKAEVHLKAAIRFHPEFHAPYLHLGTLYFRKGDYKQAIGVLSEGLSKQGANRSSMYEMIGQAREMTKEYSLAIKAYREAMLSTLATGEMNIFSENIKRCRKKRWSTLLSS
jgi:predicted Zn-dependent protease